MAYYTDYYDADNYDPQEPTFVGTCSICGDDCYEAENDNYDEYFPHCGLSWQDEGVGDCANCRRRVLVVPYPEEDKSATLENQPAK